jgi:hypothetical protein
MDSKLASLHKHWLNADAVKQIVKTPIADKSGVPNNLAEFHSSFARLSVLYGLTYVVIEGYRELKVTNKKVDELISQKDFVNSLRLFRNSTFHYQKAPISEKALTYLELPESEHWIRELHIAFKQYFEENLPVNEMLEKLNT